MGAFNLRTLTLTAGGVMITLGLAIPIGIYREVILHRHLLKSGVPVQAVVVDSWQETRYRGKYSLRSTDYYVELNYKARDKTISITRIVDRRDCGSSKFLIRYDPNDPRTFVFVDNPKSVADMALGLILGLIITTIGILFISGILFPLRTESILDWFKNDAVIYKD